MSDNFIYVYMCAVDFSFELGEAKGGTKLYASIKDLKENHSCWEECGITKVKVGYVESVAPPTPYSRNNRI